MKIPEFLLRCLEDAQATGDPDLIAEVEAVIEEIENA